MTDGCRPIEITPVDVPLICLLSILNREADAGGAVV